MPHDTQALENGMTDFTAWRVVMRDHLNPVGHERIFRIGLAPAEAAGVTWRAGDLAEFEMPDGNRRTYSISSVPSEGRLDLLVREVRTPDGTFGRGTAWLLHELRLDDRIRVRIRHHEAFHAPVDKCPLLLIGAGSGLAGLRPHILEAAEVRRPVWLVYGERHIDRDNRLCRELQSMHQSGRLYRLNLAFSRFEDGHSYYVQDVIMQYATDISHYLGAAGAIMTCGSLVMGQAAEMAAKWVMGDNWMNTASSERRYRKALY